MSQAVHTACHATLPVHWYKINPQSVHKWQLAVTVRKMKIGQEDEENRIDEEAETEDNNEDEEKG